MSVILNLALGLFRKVLIRTHPETSFQNGVILSAAKNLCRFPSLTNQPPADKAQ
jgi:hypothetical protein